MAKRLFFSFTGTLSIISRILLFFQVVLARSDDLMTVKPFTANISDATIEDLKSRLHMARFPATPAPVSDEWRQGIPLAIVREMVNHWQIEYDMSRLGQVLNSYPQFTAEVDEQIIHFWHIKSPSTDATPMLMVHGWPGSILEFRHVIDDLTNPLANEKAFHLVIPSLPGYGFSSIPTMPGTGVQRSADIFSKLMEQLGYADAGYIAQGGDFGADIVAVMANRSAKGLLGVHMNSAFFDVEAEAAQDRLLDLPTSPDASKALALQIRWEAGDDAYFEQQRTRPQTLGYGLTDSPVGLLSWLSEKIVLWSQHGTLQNQSLNSSIDLDIDEIIDNVMLYWVTNTVTSSMRMYWETQADNTALAISSNIAVGVSLFAADISWSSQQWAERYYSRLVHWNEVHTGGHFAAWERPRELVFEIRAFVQKMSQSLAGGHFM